MLSSVLTARPFSLISTGCSSAECAVPRIFLTNRLLFGGEKYSAITPSITNSSTPNAEKLVLLVAVSAVSIVVQPNVFSLSANLNSVVRKILGSLRWPILLLLLVPRGRSLPAKIGRECFGQRWCRHDLRAHTVRTQNVLPSDSRDQPNGKPNTPAMCRAKQHVPDEHRSPGPFLPAFAKDRHIATD